MTDKTFSLDDLCTLVDLPRRTVRYYMQLGLVDRSVGETRAAHYTSKHLHQLLRVKQLADAGVRRSGSGHRVARVSLGCSQVEGRQAMLRCPSAA